MDYSSYTSIILWFSGLGSIAFASIAALYQKRMKRLLAYSTISHTGFILLAICCNTNDSLKSSMLYIVLYVLMSLAVFSVIYLASLNNQLPKYLVNWSALSQRNFCFGITFTFVLFSIAGIPPLAGFYSKLCVIFSLISQNYIVTTLLVAILSSIACFYYIRLVKIFFFTSFSKNNY